MPEIGVAYQSGAFYEILASALLFALIWPLRSRFRRPGTLLATVVALYAGARFLIFFVIRDTDVVALGLRQAQLTSLTLIAAALVAIWWLRARGPSEDDRVAVRGDAAAG